MAVTAAPVSVPRMRARVVPFVEIALAHPEARRLPTVFEPRQFYGGTSLSSLSAGVRVHAGRMRARMGRYGVLADPLSATMSHEMHH